MADRFLALKPRAMTRLLKMPPGPFQVYMLLLRDAELEGPRAVSYLSLREIANQLGRKNLSGILTSLAYLQRAKEITRTTTWSGSTIVL